MEKKQKNSKNSLKEKFLLRQMIMLFAMIIFSNIASATISLDGVSFDPAVIAAGDEIDIIINFQDKSVDSFSNDGSYKLHAWIESSDTVTKEYVTFLDSEGDRNIGHLFTGDVWRKNFRLKIADNAPVGTYEFKALFQYEFNGKLQDVVQEKVFTMNVKKEGISLDITNLNTVPSRVKAGDNFVTVITNLDNSGSKSAKNIEVSLIIPAGFEHSYSNNNQVYVGLIPAESFVPLTFTLDIENDIVPGEHELNFKMDFKDIDNNEYNKEVSLPIYIIEKPIIDVVSSVGSGLAGRSNELRVTVKNTGYETAESVDVRIIKQNSQPFDFEVRSNYIGELKPNEEGVAIFKIDINSDAEVKEHDFKVIIRAKGDSDEGDDTIYTYSRRAKFNVSGVAPNNILRFGIGISALLVVGLIFRKVTKKQ